MQLPGSAVLPRKAPGTGPPDGPGCAAIRLKATVIPRAIGGSGGRQVAVKYDEFLARVRERGEYSSQDEARQVTEAVLGVLASRISPGEANDLASQLPGPLQHALTDGEGKQAEKFGIKEFYQRVAQRTGARPRTALWDASAVLTTVADAVSGGELNQVLSQLPSGYAVLFGKADLAD